MIAVTGKRLVRGMKGVKVKGVVVGLVRVPK